MNFHMPVKLFFGPGQIKLLKKIITEDLNALKPILVTDKGIVRAGLTKNVTESFPGIHVFDDIEANPKSDTINHTAVRIRKIKPDLVIAMGGGSALDAGKAIALLVTNKGDIQAYEGKKKYRNNPLPVLAVPTTCGTGSEVTWVSVITDTERNFKMSIKGPEMYPAAAIVDPDLIKTLPPGIVASTGLDALTHALEAYTSKPATLVTDTFAIKAIRLILNSIEDASHDICSNHKARENLMYGSMIAGFAFGNSDVTAVHCISESVGALYDVPHGIANSIFLPHVLSYNLPDCTEKLARVACEIGIIDASKKSAAEKLIEKIFDLSVKLKIPTLKGLGIGKDAFDLIAEYSFNNNSNSSNPRDLGIEDYVKILENAYEYER